MTQKEFYQQLATLTERELLTLHPGPFAFVGTRADALAAKLLLWLFDQLPEEATQGDVEEILGMALWWVQFFNMLREGERWREREAAAASTDVAMPAATPRTDDAPDGRTAGSGELVHRTTSSDAAGGIATSDEGIRNLPCQN